MAIIRKEHMRNYTIVDNGFIRDETLSLKAKGLMLTLLSLPDDWSFTEKWLISQSTDGVSAVNSCINELKEHGYLTRERERKEDGTWGEMIYTIYEAPISENPIQVSRIQENPQLLNTYIEPSTNKTNTAKTIKHRFGEYGHVLLTDADVEKLKSKFPSDWEQRIKALDEGIELKGYKYKNYYLAILSWAKRDEPKETPQKRGLREG
jgi:hypothetical protein